MTIQAFLDQAVAQGAWSAVVALTGNPEAVLEERTAGEARRETRFDYASLTKPFTATLALVLDADGTLSLSAKVGDLWPEAHRDLARRPLADLLRHRSGLAAWTPLYHRCRSVEEAVDLIVRGGEAGELMGARAGTYSDLGFILWGAAAERRTGETLARLFQSRALDPLGLATVEPAPGARPDVAPSFMGTGKEMKLAAAQGFAIPDLGPPPLGRPQDGNARFLIEMGAGGGVCGHAGLFGGARDLWRLAAEWLAPGSLLKQESVAAALGGGGRFALGWWRRTLRGSAGRALSPAAFGFTGFAGNSLWIDPDPLRVYVLLGSRLDPAMDMNRWRRRFHQVAAPAAGRNLSKREAT